MKKILLAGAALLVIAVSCSPKNTQASNHVESPTPVSQQIDPQMRIIENIKDRGAYTVARTIKEMAYDEGSVKFRNWKMHAVPTDPTQDITDVHLIITGEYNGKNRFGAYTGFTSFIASMDPDNGSVQKFYDENDPDRLYILALALIEGNTGTISSPILGPS